MPFKDPVKATKNKRESAIRCRAATNARKRKRYKEDAVFREHEKKLSRAQQIKSLYGISGDEYDVKLQSQVLCGLCEQPLLNTSETPHLDHDHDTNQVREFLHPACNKAIGLLKDNSHMCRLAAEYLERYGK